MHKFFLILLLMNCTNFIINPNKDNKVDFEKSDIEINYELVGWEVANGDNQSPTVLKTLQKSKRFQKISSSIKKNDLYKILILSEASPPVGFFLHQPSNPVSHQFEETPFQSILFLGNRILSGRSLFLFPFIRYSKDRISFIIYKNNFLFKTYSYQVESLHSFGWISFAFIMNNKNNIENEYEEITYKFLKDSKNDF